MIRGSLFAIGLIALPSISFAESDIFYDDRWYVDVLATVVEMDQDRGLDDQGYGGSAILGIPLGYHWSWETQLGFYTLETDGDNSTDFYQTNLNTGLRYSFGDPEDFTPFLLAGIGIVENDVIPDRDDSINFLFNIGAGLLSSNLFGTELRMRLEARYVYDHFDGFAGNGEIASTKGNGAFKDWHLSLGINLPLGAPRTMIREQEFIDSDGDSVPDERDDCPDTLPNAKVDAHGCLITNQVLVLHSINFELSSAQILTSSHGVLDMVVSALKSQDNFNLEVIGHTDSTGSDEFNQNLSEQRAESIIQYFVDQGVNPDRLTFSGKGESQPIAGNDSISGRAMNRRVEFHISDR